MTTHGTRFRACHSPPGSGAGCFGFNAGRCRCPGNPEAFENDRVVLAPAPPAGGLRALPVPAVFTPPAFQGQVILALVPGKIGVGVVEGSQSQFDAAQDDPWGSLAVAGNPVRANSGQGCPVVQEFPG